MYKNKQILGLIPARGGSKGLPRKNILPLLGKPLIAWTIEQARASKYLDMVVVSTDDEEIAGISKNYGAEVPFMRPEELARDLTPTMDVIVHALDFFEGRSRRFDYLALFEPTSPLRADNDIDNAVRLLIDNDDRADSLISMGEVHLEHPSIMKTLRDGYVAPYDAAAPKAQRRQDLEKVYFPYGVIYIAKTGKLLAHKTFYQERTISYLIERWQNYEVDDLFDFLCIGTVLEHKVKEGKI